MNSKWLDRTEIICRYFICLLMLTYGLVKVFGGQFYTDYFWKELPLEKMDGMQLTWAYYNYSPFYETLLGLAEVLAGLLVFFRRTTRLGILLFIPLMLNIVIVNILYKIGALGSAIPLLIAGILLLIIHRRAYMDLLQPVKDFVSKSLYYKVPQFLIIICGVALASLIIYNNKFRIKQDNRIKGAWQTKTHNEIRVMYFEKGKVCVFKNVNDNLIFLNYNTVGNSRLILSDETRKTTDTLSYSLTGNNLLQLTDKTGKKSVWEKNSLH